MNAAETLKAARSAGLTIIIAGEKLSVSGDGDRRADLVESIRLNKHEIITLIETESAKEASKAKQGVIRGSMVKPAELRLPEMMPRFTPYNRNDLVDQVLRQGEPAIGWCLARANAYFEKFPESSFEDQDSAAASDFLHWQDESAREK